MAGAGYKLFNTGDVLTAAQVNTYLMEQTVMVFASATARTTALSGVLAEGMLSYLQDTNAVEVYNGSAWVNVGSTGDITAVNVTSPITGGGSSGDVTIGIQDGTTAQKGAVQLENSISSTSTTTAAVPASVKTAYDLANGAIAKSIVDAKGDLIVATAADTVSRLAVGTTNGHTLQVDSSTATGLKWAASGGKTWQQTASGSMTGTGITVSSLTGDEILIAFQDWSHNSGSNEPIYWRLNNNSGSIYRVQSSDAAGTEGRAFGAISAADTSWSFLYVPAASTTAQVKTAISNLYPWSVKEPAAITSIRFYLAAGSFDAGNYYVWELK